MDEVLAVGDAEFQKKAIGKMQDVSTNEGKGGGRGKGKELKKGEESIRKVN